MRYSSNYRYHTVENVQRCDIQDHTSNAHRTGRFLANGNDCGNRCVNSVIRNGPRNPNVNLTPNIDVNDNYKKKKIVIE